MLNCLSQIQKMTPCNVHIEPPHLWFCSSFSHYCDDISYIFHLDRGHMHFHLLSIFHPPMHYDELDLLDWVLIPSSWKLLYTFCIWLSDLNPPQVLLVLHSLVMPKVLYTLKIRQKVSNMKTLKYNQSNTLNQWQYWCFINKCTC